MNLVATVVSTTFSHASYAHHLSRDMFCLLHVCTIVVAVVFIDWPDAPSEVNVDDADGSCWLLLGKKAMRKPHSESVCVLATESGMNEGGIRVHFRFAASAWACMSRVDECS